jgi:hypothetical protein
MSSITISFPKTNCKKKKEKKKKESKTIKTKERVSEILVKERG